MKKRHANILMNTKMTRTGYNKNTPGEASAKNGEGAVEGDLLYTLDQPS